MFDQSLYLKISDLMREYYSFGLQCGTKIYTSKKGVTHARINFAYADDQYTNLFVRSYIKGLTAAGVHVRNYGNITLPHFLYSVSECENKNSSIYFQFNDNNLLSVLCFDENGSYIDFIKDLNCFSPKKVEDYTGFQIMEKENLGYFDKFKNYKFDKKFKIVWASESTVMANNFYKIAPHDTWIFVKCVDKKLLTQKVISNVLQSKAQLGVIFDAKGINVKFIDSNGKAIDNDSIFGILLESQMTEIEQVSLDSHCNKNLISKFNDGIQFIDNIWQCKNAYGYCEEYYKFDNQYDALLTASVVVDHCKNNGSPTTRIYKWICNEYISFSKLSPCLEKQNLKAIKVTQNTTRYSNKTCSVLVTVQDNDIKRLTIESEEIKALYDLKNDIYDQLALNVYQMS